MLSKKSFTLIEMLLVTSLMAMIGLAVYHSLVNGMKIWDASTRYTAEEDVALFFDKISQDIRSATNYSLIKFDGMENRISFATVVRTLSDPLQSPQPEYISQIGRVEYEFDKSSNILFRRQANYGQAMAEEFDPPRTMLPSVSFVKFSYYWMESERMVVKDRIKDGQWPVSVLIEAGFAGNGEKLNTLSRVIDIPTGNGL